MLQSVVHQLDYEEHLIFHDHFGKPDTGVVNPVTPPVATTV